MAKLPGPEIYFDLLELYVDAYNKWQYQVSVLQPRSCNLVRTTCEVFKIKRRVLAGLLKTPETYISRIVSDKIEAGPELLCRLNEVIKNIRGGGEIAQEIHRINELGRRTRFDTTMSILTPNGPEKFKVHRRVMEKLKPGDAVYLDRGKRIHRMKKGYRYNTKQIGVVPE